jgi:hypothetical protein
MEASSCGICGEQCGSVYLCGHKEQDLARKNQYNTLRFVTSRLRTKEERLSKMTFHKSWDGTEYGKDEL